MSLTDDPERVAREHVLNEHPALVARILECADAVAAGWDGSAATDAADVGERLAAVMEHAGVQQRLPAVLQGSVQAIGAELSATPVPAPPYVVVTNRGPVLRATTGAGRLVVTIGVFDVERGTAGGPRYVRRAETPGEAVEVELRSG